MVNTEAAQAADRNRASGAPAGTEAPWWRVRMLWLVIGGPAAVVVASMATLLIALTHPDPLVATGAAAEESAAPAVQARNHAANPKR